MVDNQLSKGVIIKGESITMFDFNTLSTLAVVAILAYVIKK